MSGSVAASCCCRKDEPPTGPDLCICNVRAGVLPVVRARAVGTYTGGVPHGFGGLIAYVRYSVRVESLFIRTDLSDDCGGIWVVDPESSSVSVSIMNVSLFGFAAPWWRAYPAGVTEIMGGFRDFTRGTTIFDACPADQLCRRWIFAAIGFYGSIRLTSQWYSGLYTSTHESIPIMAHKPIPVGTTSVNYASALLGKYCQRFYPCDYTECIEQTPIYGIQVGHDPPPVLWTDEIEVTLSA